MHVDAAGTWRLVCVLSVYHDVSYMLLLPGVLTTLLEVSSYTCRQGRERWRVGGREVFDFKHILIKAGSFNHRLISIREKGEGQVEREGKGETGLQTQTTTGLWKDLTLPQVLFTFPKLFLSCIDRLRCLFSSVFLVFCQQAFLFLLSCLPPSPFFCPCRAMLLWTVVEDTGRAPPCH